MVVQAHLGWERMRCRDPVNGTLDLAAIRGPPTPSGRVIRTTQLNHLTRALVLHHPRAGEIVGVAQADLAARGQTEELLWRVLTKIIAFDIQHARERHLARAHAGVFR